MLLVPILKPAQALVALLALSPTLILTVNALPSYSYLSGGNEGVSKRGIAEIIQAFHSVHPPPPPGPLRHDGAKLVDDRAHPFREQRRGDIRGPCPGLNTLASHGYIPRNGVATPAQLITASQEGFNMENKVARFTTYIAHLIDGNLVTDLLSIGEKTRKTGLAPPPPAIVGGLNNHGTFEGDASLTRGDAFFGDNHNFNQTLFDQFKDFSARFGGGFYNYTVAAELRFARIQQSIATNPEFSNVGFRHLTLYAEAGFPANLFVDGRANSSAFNNGQPPHHLDMDSAESFFKHGRFPRGFFRSNRPLGLEGLNITFGTRPTVPGRNVEGVNTFVEDQSLGSILDHCGFYERFVNVTVKGLYPNPKGVLRRNLKVNLQFLFDALLFDGCVQQFPYGR